MTQLPDGDFERDDVLALVEAVLGARFALHTALLGAQSAEDIEGLEVWGETLRELQSALKPIYGSQAVPPICRGCSPLKMERDGFNESENASLVLKTVAL